MKAELDRSPSPKGGGPIEGSVGMAWAGVVYMQVSTA